MHLFARSTQHPCGQDAYKGIEATTTGGMRCLGCGAHCICNGQKQGKLKTAFPELPDGPEKLQTASPEPQDGPEKQKTGFRPEARLPERGHKGTGFRQYTPVPHAKECYTNQCPSSHVSEVLPNSNSNSALNRPLLSTNRGNILYVFLHNACFSK